MRLIDADRLKEQDFGEDYYTIKAEIDKAPTVNAIQIPDNVTNGEVIKALFGFEPNKNSCIMPKNKCNGNPCECDGCQYNDWWNAPYKAGDTDGKNNN